MTSSWQTCVRRLLSVAILIGLSTGCTGPWVPVGLPPAFIFANYQAPLLFNPDVDTSAVPLDELYTGKSYSFNVTFPYTGTLSSVGWGDGRLQEAARKANVGQIVYADYTHVKYLTLFNYLEFRVHGIADKNPHQPD